MSHVLLILVDALRADHLGCYAGKDLGTPNMDRLARQGVLFENAISQGSWTRPSTACIMTGLYLGQNGLGTRWRETEEGRLSARSLDPSIPTVAEILTAGGHTTAFVGSNATLKPLFGITRGFTHHLWRSTNDGAVIADDFERWLRTERPESSFCYVHFMDVHNPLPMETIPARLDTGLDLNLVSDGKDELAGYYAAAVRRADRHVGRVIGTLESAGMLEDTLIILSADHGEELGEHGGMLSHGRTLYRELVRVPLIVRLPGGSFAGERIEQPVQSIDFVPTILDHLRHPPADVPGSNLLPLIRGEETRRTAAFSEHVKPDRYSQSVTTRTHQLIKSYRLEEETRLGSPTDLQPGLWVAVKGHRVRDDRFIPTKVLIEQDCVPTLSGPVDQVDAAGRSVTLMGIACQIDGDTKFTGKEGEPLTLERLAVGDRVTVNFTVGADGRRVATAVKRRPPGGKSMIKGRIEGARDEEDGLRAITVLGMEILVDGSTKVKALKGEGRREAKGSPVNRVLTGDFIEEHTELYDVINDPAETRNIVDERPDIAQELEEALATFTQSLEERMGVTVAGNVDVDPETREQLRLMGYIE